MSKKRVTSRDRVQTWDEETGGTGTGDRETRDMETGSRQAGDGQTRNRQRPGNRQSRDRWAVGCESIVTR